MRNAILFLMLSLIISCRSTHSALLIEEGNQMELHESLDRIEHEYKLFEQELILLYTDAESNPEKVLLKANSLLALERTETDKRKKIISAEIEQSLHRLKAEIFYKTGNYKGSIRELATEDYRFSDAGAAYAANYVQLKDYSKAKQYIDKINNYIYAYALGNYYECIGNANEALKVYEGISLDKSAKRYTYYKLALGRIDALKQNTPTLLREIYFPTGNPSVRIFVGNK